MSIEGGGERRKEDELIVGPIRKKRKATRGASNKYATKEIASQADAEKTNSVSRSEQ